MNAFKNEPELKKASNPTYDTMLSSLTLRINEPYWLLHAGNCEHTIVFESIRYAIYGYSDVVALIHVHPD